MTSLDLLCLRPDIVIRGLRCYYHAPFFFFLMTGNCYDLYVCAGKGMRMKSGFLFYSPFGLCCSAKSAFDCGVVICRSINDVIVWIRKIRRSFVHSREVLCYQSFSGQIQQIFVNILWVFLSIFSVSWMFISVLGRILRVQLLLFSAYQIRIFFS